MTAPRRNPLFPVVLLVLGALAVGGAVLALVRTDLSPDRTRTEYGWFEVEEIDP